MLATVETNFALIYLLWLFVIVKYSIEKHRKL